jgi:hypothetical protein
MTDHHLLANNKTRSNGVRVREIPARGRDKNLVEWSFSMPSVGFHKIPPFQFGRKAKKRPHAVVLPSVIQLLRPVLCSPNPNSPSGTARGTEVSAIAIAMGDRSTWQHPCYDSSEVCHVLSALATGTNPAAGPLLLLLLPWFSTRDRPCPPVAQHMH